MSRKAIIATLGLLAALNILGVAVDLSRASKAATPSFQELIDNPDFARAVKAIAEQCRVNVDIGRQQRWSLKDGINGIDDKVLGLTAKLMSISRPTAFWIGVLVTAIAAVALLREVLLPFVAGMVLAYLLNPLATRIERLGVRRSLATLAIILLAATIFVVLLILALPMVVRELAHFIESLPLYTRRLHSLAIHCIVLLRGTPQTEAIK
jgi:AI-2E family transporter